MSEHGGCDVYSNDGPIQNGIISTANAIASAAKSVGDVASCLFSPITCKVAEMAVPSKDTGRYCLKPSDPCL